MNDDKLLNVLDMQLLIENEEEGEDPDPQRGPLPPQDPPQNPGDCVFMRHERPEQDGPPPQQDNWYISGDIFGPEALFMHSEEQTIVLEKTMAEDGFVRYEMLDCRQDTFPFGEVFDLLFFPDFLSAASAIETKTTKHMMPIRAIIIVQTNLDARRINKVHSRL